MHRDFDGLGFRRGRALKMHSAGRRLLERRAGRGAAVWAATALIGGAALVAAGNAEAAAACAKPVYLTIDTGHMGVANLIADVLARQHVKATFFLANEKTLTGGSSLDDVWAPWWKARVTEGHAFGSHTFDHVYWTADLPNAADGFRVKPSAGPDTDKREVFTPAQYCEEIDRSAQRFHAMTGRVMPKIFRAPGGKTSPALLKAAAACGWTYVPWAASGFLGDELSSEKYPNASLLAKALRNVKPGDIMLMHLGIWSRKDPWAPADLEPLIVGLKAKGYCFETLREHPLYRGLIAATEDKRP